MLGSIRATLIETFDERYAAAIEAITIVVTAVVAAVRPQGIICCGIGSLTTRSYMSLMGPRIRLLL